MNFNRYIVVFFLFFFLHSCGVKDVPKAPPGTSLPSFIGEYVPELEKDEKKETENSTKKK